MKHILIASLRHELNELSDEELHCFAALWTIQKEVPRNELLYTKGRAEQTLYFVVHGALRVCYATQEDELVVGFAYENTFILDLPSFLTGTASSFYIQAIKNSCLLGIKKQAFDSFLDTSLGFATYWRRKTELLLLESVEREIDLLTQSPEERYKRLFNRRPELFQLIPNRHIASYLRMTPETLSRLKKTLI